MMALVGGFISLVFGIIGIIIWWGYFLQLLAGGIPVMLILGGALATYLGIEELKELRIKRLIYFNKKDRIHLIPKFLNSQFLNHDF